MDDKEEKHMDEEKKSFDFGKLKLGQPIGDEKIEMTYGDMLRGALAPGEKDEIGIIAGDLLDYVKELSVEGQWDESIDFTIDLYNASLEKDTEKQLTPLEKIYDTYIVEDEAEERRPINISYKSRQDLHARHAEGDRKPLILTDFQAAYNEIMNLLVRESRFTSGVKQWIKNYLDRQRALRPEDETKEEETKEEADFMRSMSYSTSKSKSKLSTAKSFFPADRLSPAEKKKMEEWDHLMTAYRLGKTFGAIHGGFLRKDPLRQIKHALKVFFETKDKELPLYLQIERDSSTIDLHDKKIQDALVELRKAYAAFKIEAKAMDAEKGKLRPERVNLILKMEHFFDKVIGLEAFLESEQVSMLKRLKTK